MKAVLFLFKFLIVLVLIHFEAVAQVNDCPKSGIKELKSKNETYVEIQAGGSSKNLLKEESIAPFDLESQRKELPNVATERPNALISTVSKSFKR